MLCLICMRIRSAYTSRRNAWHHLFSSSSYILYTIQEHYYKACKGIIVLVVVAGNGSVDIWISIMITADNDGGSSVYVHGSE